MSGRLAGIDMYGTRGTPRRRRLILAEFTIGAAVMVVFGAWLVAVSSGAGGRVLGIWILGSGQPVTRAEGTAIRPQRPRRPARQGWSPLRHALSPVNRQG